MLINLFEFEIGITQGTYPPQSLITDSILKRADVSYILVDSTISKNEVVHDKEKGTLVFPASINIYTGNIVTVVFRSPVEF